MPTGPLSAGEAAATAWGSGRLGAGPLRCERDLRGDFSDLAGDPDRRGRMLRRPWGARTPFERGIRELNLSP